MASLKGQAFILLNMNSELALDPNAFQALDGVDSVDGLDLSDSGAAISESAGIQLDTLN